MAGRRVLKWVARRNFYDVNESYASGMKATADKIKSASLVAGIWFKPFSGTSGDPWFADKQDLFATMDGKPYNAKWGGDCLDMTNPKSQDYMSELARMISKDWGYKYFKLDGMWCGTATQQKYINTYYVDDEIGESKLFQPRNDSYRSVSHRPEEAAQGGWRRGLHSGV